MTTLDEIFGSILIREMQERRPINTIEVRARQRIALELPNGSYDVMKVDRVGEFTGRTIAVALVCPGQASFIVQPDGSATYNVLEETGSDGRWSWLGDSYGNFPGKDSMGMLDWYTKAHWQYLQDKRIVPLSRSEMRTLQGLLP